MGNTQKHIIERAVYFIVLFVAVFIGSVLLSHLFYSLQGQDIKIGFPFVFYWEFSVHGNDFKNFSWFPKKFVLDFVIVFLLSAMFFNTFWKEQTNK